MTRNVEPMEMGQRMANLRMKMEMSQERFAELIDVSRNTVANLENGKTTFSLPVLMNLFKKTEITPNQMFFGQDSSSKVSRINDLICGMTESEEQEFLRMAEVLAAGIMARRSI